MLLAAVMPPFCDRTEASFSSIFAMGSDAARIVAPCAMLLSPIRPTGIQMNFACDLSGLAACQSAAQCGHCGSKNTYTACAAIGAPTVKPFAPDSMAASVTGVLAAAAFGASAAVDAS